MAKHLVTKHADPLEDTSFILKWGKIVTRITAISATITGAFAAIFSSSSVGGIGLTAMGAGTLAAAEKIPDPRYTKTKHIPPRPLKKQKSVLTPDILARPEKIATNQPPRPVRKEQHIIRPPASFQIKN